MFECEVCEKSFESKMQYFGHKRVHGPSKGRAFQKPTYIKHPVTGEVITQRQMETYDKNLVHCENCDKIFHKKEKDQKFCSLTCAGKVNREKQMDTLAFKVPNLYRRTKLKVIKFLASTFTMSRKKYEMMQDTIEIKQELVQDILNDFPRIWLFKVIEPFLKLMLFTKPNIRLVFISILFLMSFRLFWFMVGLI